MPVIFLDNSYQYFQQYGDAMDILSQGQVTVFWDAFMFMWRMDLCSMITHNDAQRVFGCRMA